MLDLNDLFLWTTRREQDFPWVKKREVALQIKQKGNRWLRLAEVCSLEFLQNYCPSNTRHFL